MKALLLHANVTPMERAVLLDMAGALVDGSTVYSWGHPRLAMAIGKEPGSTAAKSALSQRIIPSLIEKGLIVKMSDAHRSANAVYRVAILDTEPVDKCVDKPVDRPVDKKSMGSGLDPEWVAVSGVMGSAQTATPAPNSTLTAPGGMGSGTHSHLPNAVRALTTLARDRSLPLPVDELIPHATRLGNGDPWAGYLVIKDLTEDGLKGARRPDRVLLSRLEAAP